MRFTHFASLFSLSALASATAIPAEQASSCTNGPTSRNCWSSGFDINTDYDSATNGWPNTGKTVTYNLEITNSTCNPDGHGSRICFLINGQFPGPTITANWGDNVVVNVKNSLQDNATSIHWHGVRQLNSVGSDGTNGLTECPLAPGQSRAYKWQATQYGTSWYHSHYSAQYGDGVLGPIVINGPASSNYDTDLGTFVLNDWWYQTAWQVNAEAQANQNSGLPGPLAAAPAANNILINGQSQDALGRGNYPNYTITAGKKYRLRFIGATADNYFHVSLDNHSFLVVAADFVPIKPFSTNYLTIGAGQRYDVIITADQSARNYWLRADVASECFSLNNGKGRAIFTYAGFPKAIPLFSNSFIAPLSCAEPGPLVPVWNKSVPSGDFTSELQTVGLGQSTAKASTGGGNVVLWTLDQSIDIDYMQPTLSYVMNGNTSYPESYNLVPTSSEGDWNYWLMQQNSSAPPIPHPMHIHGHDFFVLGSGSGTFSSSNIASLNFASPTRRDTVTIPANGWLAVAYESNNPGTWLMHCHIAWHIAGGLGQQYLEAPDKIVLPNKAQYDAQCAAYDSWYANAPYKVLDSGL